REERQAYVARLVAHYQRYGRAGFVEYRGPWGFAAEGRRLSPLAALLGSLIVAVWLAMLVAQGEGVDIDLQRRRHPMWEWLLSHPVDPRAVFLAEMISPLAANFFLLTAPLFWIGAFWMAYDDPGVGLAAGLLAGTVFGIAAGCLGKTIEIVALLRLPPRSRGAALGILSWLGQAAFMLMMFVAFSSLGSSGLLLAVVRPLAGLTAFGRWPLLDAALGLFGAPSAWKGVVFCGAAAAALIAAAVQVSAAATRQGLAGGFGGSTSSAAKAVGPGWLVRDPLHRKELLWLRRDRGALIQAFLIPLTV